MTDWFDDVLADCPGLYGNDYCAHEDNVVPSFGMIPVYFSLCSCIASMIGSILMIIPYILWKDIRSSLRTIVTYLAIADFFTAFGYTIASFNYIRYEKEKMDDFPKACQTFSTICQIQAYISSWASLSSFWWTAILACYLYFTITKGNANTLNKCFPFFHVLVWGSPILVMLPLLCTGSLGYSLFSAGGWCYISSNKKLRGLQFTNYNINYDLSVTMIIKILAGGKALELITYMIVMVLYGVILYKIQQKKKEAESLTGVFDEYNKLLKHLERKLYAIPLAFILFRIWGTLQFCFSIGVFVKGGTVDETGCVPSVIYYIYYVLACLQSVGDGGQGWCNAILYILFSPNIRKRLMLLLATPIRNCIQSTNNNTRSDERKMEKT